MCGLKDLGGPLYVQGGSNMTGTDFCVNKPVTVPVIFEPPCIMSKYFQSAVSVYI